MSTEIEHKLLNEIHPRLRNIVEKRLMTDCCPFDRSNCAEAMSERVESKEFADFCRALADGESLIALEKGREITIDYWVTWVVNHEQRIVEKDFEDVRVSRALESSVNIDGAWQLPKVAA
ncbi:MAG: hypothetical protein H6R01_464 [Burkholderiaceae bacterium]|nr:hypothetical protein [Burkholderiaceae bacterium]